MATQKKKTAAAQSASSHQKDLAKISGNTAAEKKMSEIKKSGQRLGVLDATGAAKSRAEKKTLKSFEKGKVSPTKKPSLIESGNKSGKLATPKIFKKENKPNKVEKLIQDVTNRYRVTAREARDIVTAVNNVGMVALNKSDTGFSADKKGTNKTTAGAPGGRKNQLGKAVKDLKTQVSEAGKAAVTGKKQTSSGKFMTISGEEPAYLQPGKKRK